MEEKEVVLTSVEQLNEYLHKTADDKSVVSIVQEQAAYAVHEPQERLDPDRLMVRPTYRNFGVYETIGINRARVIYEGSEQECRNKIKELRDRYRESGIGDNFKIYQLKDDESLRYIRFEGLERIKNQGQTVDRDNYDLVYEAPLKPGTTLDDLYYEFNMQHPLDFRGHSMSVSDIVVIHSQGEDKAFYVDTFGFTEVPDFLLEKAQEQQVDMDEAAYKLGDRYISIQRTDEGFDYSIYDEEYHLLDGGVYDDPDMSIGEVLKEITNELKQPIYDEDRDIYSHSEVQGSIRQSDTPERVDFDELMEKTEEVGLSEIEKVKSDQKIVSDFRSKTEGLFVTGQFDGMTPATIEDAVRDQVQTVIDDYGLDARIEDVIVSGSRCRGLEKEASDLDVVVSFSGAEREDDLFNLLHEETLIFGSKGVVLDINPINVEQTGTLAEYLPGEEKYLAEKAAKIEHEKVEKVTEPEKPKQVVTFTVAESSEFHSFGELHEGIPRLEDALKVYEDICERSNLNGIPAVGINIHTVGTPAYEDMQCDFLSGKRLDLDALMYLPEMSQNEEVIEALHDMKEAYPDVEVVGRFPDEIQQDAIAFGHDVQKSEEDLDAVKPVADLSSIELAQEIDAFARDFDFYDYNDMVDDREANVRQIAESIETGNTGYINEVLQEILTDDDGTAEDQRKAKELIDKLAEYKPLAKVEEREEQNFNMIDNVLNNLPQDPEEKKEPAPQKEMRIAEVKKVRKRVSMKKLLPQKMAEAAEREKKSPEAGAPSRRPGMGVDD